MKTFIVFGIVGGAFVMASAAIAAAPAGGALPEFVPSTSQFVTVSEIGPVFNGRVDLKIPVNGLDTAYRNGQNIGYIASVTQNNDGKLALTPGSVIDGVTVNYKASQMPDRRVVIRVSFTYNKVLPFGEYSVDGKTIDLPNIEQTKYNGVGCLSYGKPASLNIPVPGHGTATLRFTVSKN